MVVTLMNYDLFEKLSKKELNNYVERLKEEKKEIEEIFKVYRDNRNSDFDLGYRLFFIVITLYFGLISMNQFVNIFLEVNTLFLIFFFILFICFVGDSVWNWKKRKRHKENMKKLQKKFGHLIDEINIITNILFLDDTLKNKKLTQEEKESLKHESAKFKSKLKNLYGNKFLYQNFGMEMDLK